MKKFFILIFTLCLVVLAPDSSWAINSNRVMVLPVDIPTTGSSFSIYPDTLSLVSADIVNILHKDYQFSVVDINSAEKLIINSGLYDEYKDLMRQYKDRYILNYVSLQKIAKAADVSSVLFVSGGFDTKQLSIRPTIFGFFSIPFGDPITSSYKLNLTTTLVDPLSTMVIWEGKYSGRLKIDGFDVPSQHFSENVVSVSKIKKFSRKTAPKISKKVYAHLINHKVQPVNIIDGSNYDLAKDGELTKDGHLNIDDYVINNRKKEYKTWIESQ